MRIVARRGSDWYWCHEVRCIMMAPMERAWGKRQARRVEVYFFNHSGGEELGMIRIRKEATEDGCNASGKGGEDEAGSDSNPA